MNSVEKLPHIHYLPAASPAQEIALFGYAIPYLPDFLADHTLLGERPAEQLNEVLARLTRFVVGLRKWRESAYALRFIARPDQGRITVALLGRLAGPRDRLNTLVGQAAADLAVHLSLFGLPFTPLGAPNAGGRSLRENLFPFSGPTAIVEVRQREAIIPLLTVRQEAYVVYPYWAPAAAFLEPFESLMRQPYPAAISVYLEPTELTSTETSALFEAAHLAETVADLERKVHSDTTARRLRDPGAELVSRVYKAYRQSLEEPFLLVAQIASPDANTAWTAARTVASAVTAGRDEAPGEAAERGLPSQGETTEPQSEAELAAARRTFTTLVLTPWGRGLATPGKERFPYLVSARGAAAVFRFPISVRGGVPGVAVRQRPPDFEVGPRVATSGTDELHLGNFHSGGAVTVKVKALTRHCLITGFTGSGKTNTMLYLLDQLWRHHQIPFLVIESAKKEYRGLLGRPGFEPLLIFTLGDETTTPFRLNPFELLAGVRLEAHLGRLQTCFDGALPQFGILPSIIAEALESIYREKGWRLTDRGGAKEQPFPTMRDMHRLATQIAESRGYAGETYHNIRAAVNGRIGNLLRGSKGRMFGAQRSYPLDVLMQRPVILELNDLNADDKALTMMFLLTLVREYRELHAGRTLQHVTIVEEAHNVMGNVKSTGPSEVAADTKGVAAQAFADLLTEVRAYGEGILIADQSPAKLAPDAVRNTNLQIAHQLRDAQDREAISRALLMDKTQEEYLGKLAVGEATIFLTGMEKATFMQVPPYKERGGFDDLPTDAAVREHMRPFTDRYLTAHLPFDGCRFCGSPCQYVESIEPQTQEPELHEGLMRALHAFEERPGPEHWPEHWAGVTRVCASAATQAGQPAQVDAAYCYLAHKIHFPFTEHMRHEFTRAFEQVESD